MQRLFSKLCLERYLNCGVGKHFDSHMTNGLRYHNFLYNNKFRQKYSLITFCFDIKKQEIFDPTNTKY